MLPFIRNLLTTKYCLFSPAFLAARLTKKGLWSDLQASIVLWEASLSCIQTWVWVPRRLPSSPGAASLVGDPQPSLRSGEDRPRCGFLTGSKLEAAVSFLRFRLPQLQGHLSSGRLEGRFMAQGDRSSDTSYQTHDFRQVI